MARDWSPIGIPQNHKPQNTNISMGLCKKDVAPVRQQWSNIFLALTQRYEPLTTDHQRIDGFVQEGRNSSALAMELRPFCTNPKIWNLLKYVYFLPNNYLHRDATM